MTALTSRQVPTPWLRQARGRVTTGPPCCLIGRWETRSHASRLLGRMEGEVALFAFVAMLADPDVAWRGEALNRLNGLRHPGAVPALIDVMRTDSWPTLREVAALALGSCGESSAAEVDALLTVLNDHAEPVALRGAAAEALNGCDDERVSPALIAALEDAEPEIRFFAAFALGARTEVTALPALERLAAIEQAVLPGWGSVRDEVVTAIEHIRRRSAPDAG